MGYFCKKVCYQEVQQIAQSGHTGRGRRGGFLESNFCARKLHSTLFRASFGKSFVILLFYFATQRTNDKLVSCCQIWGKTSSLKVERNRTVNAAGLKITTSVTRKSHQMSIKVAQNDFTRKILTPFKKLPKNVGDLGILIVATGFEKLPKVQ